MQAERSSGVGMAVRVGLYMAAAVTSIVQRVWNGLTADGYLPAAVRQGADELGAALKAFPDSVQTQEHGTIFNPTQGEIARDRNGNGMQGQWHHSSARNLPTPGSSCGSTGAISPWSRNAARSRNAGWSKGGRDDATYLQGRCHARAWE